MFQPKEIKIMEPVEVSAQHRANGAKLTDKSAPVLDFGE
jgi:hypothetical protein